MTLYVFALFSFPQRKEILAENPASYKHKDYIFTLTALNFLFIFLPRLEIVRGQSTQKIPPCLTRESKEWSKKLVFLSFLRLFSLFPLLLLPFLPLVFFLLIHPRQKKRLSHYWSEKCMCERVFLCPSIPSLRRSLFWMGRGNLLKVINDIFEVYVTELEGKICEQR